MDRTIRAVYEKGILRPFEPLPLHDGETVDVTVRAGPAETLPRDRHTMANFLDEIAKIPADKPAPDDGLVGSVDHDRILYGKGAA